MFWNFAYAFLWALEMFEGDWGPSKVLHVCRHRREAGFNSFLKQHTKVNTKHKLLSVSVDMLRHGNVSPWVSDFVLSHYDRWVTGFTHACTWEDDSLTLILIFFFKQHTKENTKYKLLSVCYVEMLSAHQMSDWVCLCTETICACSNMGAWTF